MYITGFNVKFNSVNIFKFCLFIYLFIYLFIFVVKLNILNIFVVKYIAS